MPCLTYVQNTFFKVVYMSYAHVVNGKMYSQIYTHTYIYKTDLEQSILDCLMIMYLTLMYSCWISLFLSALQWVWRKDRNGITPDSPVEMGQIWYGFPHDIQKIDAVYERPGDKKIMFFKGRRWYFSFKECIKVKMEYDVNHMWKK